MQITTVEKAGEGLLLHGTGEMTARFEFIVVAGDTVVTASLALEGMTFNTADHHEAVRAFRAKEKPKFGQSE